MGDPDEVGERQIMGSLVVDEGHCDDEEGVRIRWVILASELHGQGLGRELLDRAMSYCEQSGFNRVYLWTYESLEAARHLYETHGFRLVKEEAHHDWGPEINYQLYEVYL